MDSLFARYVVLEGIDGAGKSTQAKLLSAKLLAERNITTIHLVEPTYGSYGIEVRKLMASTPPIPRLQQIDLFKKDRQEHVRKKVAPLLKFVRNHESFLVLQERSYLSLPAYQTETGEEMNAMLHDEYAVAERPDLMFILDVSAETAVGRLKLRGGHAGWFENRETLEAVRQRLLALGELTADPIVVIDANRSVNDVCGAIFEAIFD